MSLIGSVRDGMGDLRKKSLSQEQTIDRNGEFSHWRMSDVTRTSIIERGAGLAVMPLIAFWCLLLLVLGIGMSISLLSFKLLSRFFR